MMLRATFLAIALSLTFAAGSAEAAPKSARGSKKKAAPEVYSATEPEGEASVPDTILPEREPREVRMVRQAMPTPTPRPATAAAPAPEKSAPAQKMAAFEPVPAQHADAIARRLQIVERLVRVHGRAYDYRTITTRDLENILAQLDIESQLRRGATQAPAATPLPAPQLLPPFYSEGYDGGA